MRMLLLDNYTKQALHVTRVVSGVMGWTTDVFAPGVPLCSFSKYISSVYTAPNPTDRDEYFKQFVKLVSKEKYDAFLSFDDDITSVLSENEEALKSLFNLDRMFPGKESVLLADSKNRMLEFARGIGIPTPDFFVPETVTDIDTITARVSYPLVVKGEKGSGSWKVRYAKNYDEMAAYYEELQNLESDYGGRPSIQEYIKGDGHLLHVLCLDGDLIRVCDHVKLKEYPPNGGVTAVAQTCYDPVMVGYAEKICRELRWTGLAKFDFIKDADDGKYKLLELDPRISASIIVPQVAGTEMIESFCRIVQGEEVVPDHFFRSGIKYRLILPREFQYLLKNPLYISQFISGFFRKNTYSDISFSDFRPTLRNARETLYAIKEEFLNRGKAKIISSQRL